MPQTQKLRRGSVGNLLVFVFAVILVLLPAGTAGLGQLCDFVLLQRSRQVMAQVLPASYTCLDPAELSEGRPVLLTAQAGPLIRQRFTAALPAALVNRLRIADIVFIERRIQPDPAHWMGGSQPSALPVVILHAVFLDRRGREIALEHSIEILLD